MSSRQRPSTTIGRSSDHSTIPARIGLNARTIRRERRLSLSDIAGAVGITVGALSRIETGQRTPTLQTLIKICEVLGVSVAEVFQRRAVWVGPSIGKPPPMEPEFVRLSHPKEMRVGLFQGALPARAGGTSEGPAGSGVVAIAAKEGISIVRQGDLEHVIYPGDALTIRSLGPVRWVNGGRSPARALWVYTPAPAGRSSPFQPDLAC